MCATQATPLTPAELARAAELAPAAIRETRQAFLQALDAAERYRNQGYISVGRTVRRKTEGEQ